MPVFSDVALPSALAERVGCTQTTNIATSLNNDIGSLKALLVSRGSEYGTYDFMSEENYSRVEDNVVMETHTEISYLARNIMMAYERYILSEHHIHSGRRYHIHGFGYSKLLGRS